MHISSALCILHTQYMPCASITRSEEEELFMRREVKRWNFFNPSEQFNND